MAAADLRIVTIVVPNPNFDQSRQGTIVTGNTAFALRLDTSFQTLSSNNPNNYNPIEGLLYYPQLSSATASACTENDTSLVPQNITTVKNFPSGQAYNLVAIFPWVRNINCTQAFFAQARLDQVHAAMVFQPDTLMVPIPQDQSWSLGGSAYEFNNGFPIYAVPSDTGLQIMDEMSLYNGNMADAPNGTALVKEFGDQDFPRLFAHADLLEGANVPSLWIFLIIVLAVLLGIVVVASVSMHLIQRRQRRTLQRRLERGEVDLESLGIKKMNVPQHKIDEMPKYVFTEAVESPPEAVTDVTKPVAQSTVRQEHTTSFSQNTCPICLDDFVSGETEVRELPCKHIFHPECIDIFLRDNSSLCPMCKVSALAPGYCPIKVTNLMVRRERLIRRMRERRRQTLAMAIAAAGGEVPQQTRRERLSMWMQNRLYGRPAPSPRALEEARRRAELYMADTRASADQNTTESPAQAPAIELGSVPDRPAATHTNVRRQTIAIPPEIAAQGSAARRAWRRERLARQQEEQYNATAETARQADVGRPLWRRIGGRIVPGLD